MKLHAVKWLLLSVLTIVPIGCETNTTVEDEPDGATVLEDDDAESTVVTPDGTDTTTTPPAGTDTADDVDVDVNTPSTPPESDTDQSSSPNAKQ